MGRDYRRLLRADSIPNQGFNMTSLAIITTTPQTLNFFRGQVSYFRAKGIDVHVVSSPGEELLRFGERESVHTHAVTMTRAISPAVDVMSLLGLVRILQRIQPTIVHAHTPKAGLLAMLAASIVGVRVRLYTIHGLPFMTRRGISRKLLWLAELLTCRLANRVFAVSRSIANCAVAESLVSPNKVKVFGSGSINGVDAEEQFNPTRYAEQVRQFRWKLGIPEEARTIGFVGRIVRDKGIVELAAAWRRLRDEYPDLRLLLVGDFEEVDPIPRNVREGLLTDPRVRFLGWIDDPAWVYSIMDILVLPSHREGFGVVAIEASAMEVPVVATRIPGCIDSVEDGRTGSLVPVGHHEALTGAIRTYLDEPTLRRQHGRAGRRRVIEQFRPEKIWQSVYDEYQCLLTQYDLETPS